MLSSALAGMLRAGAVVLTAGALGSGVYFLVQAGDSQNDDTRLQAPSRPTATVEAPSDLSPPVDLSGPVEVKAPPTPTFPPAPIADPGIDTSDWKTYTSPLGFTLKYPPDWVVDEEESSGPRRGFALLMARDAQQAAAEGTFVIEGGNVIMPPGASVVTVDIRPRTSAFDAEEFLDECQPYEPPPGAPPTLVQPRPPTTVTVAGQPAVRCVFEGLSRGRDHTIMSEWYSVRLPGGGVVSITFLMVDAKAADLALTQALQLQLSFEDAR